MSVASAGRLRRPALVVAGLVVSIAAAWLVLRDVDPAAAVATVTRANLGLLAVALAVIAFQVVVRAARWQQLLPVDSGGPVPVARIVPPLVVGYLGNAVLPARLGEAVRSVLLARREGLPATRVLGSAVLERILDTLILALIGVLAALAIGVPDWVLRIALLAIGLSFAALALLTGAPRLLDRLGIDLPRLVHAFVEVVRGAGIRPGRALAAAAGLSVLGWLLDAAIYWLTGAALGIGLSPVQAVLVSAVVVLSTAVPSAPGYVGTFELAAVATLGFLGIGRDTALAFALVAHAVAVVPMSVAGALVVASMGLSLRELPAVSAAAR